MEIIIRGKGRKNYKSFRHRSGVEEAMRKEWGTTGVTDSELDKMKYIEKKLEMRQSSVKAILPPTDIS